VSGFLLSRVGKTMESRGTDEQTRKREKSTRRSEAMTLVGTENIRGSFLTL